MPTSKRKSSRSYSEQPDNTELNQLFGQLTRRGLTQEEIAKAIGISPGQLSRIRQGERRATSKHILSLRNKVSPLGSIDHGVLADLTAIEAVEAFRDLLWARAGELGIPTTRVSISSDESTPDGGVDASIFDGTALLPSDDELFSNGKRFQIKTGDFKAWRRSVIENELFGKKEHRFESLGEAIKETLREEKDFVLICFGVDFIDNKRRQARENLVAAFKECGYPNARVDVWGQTQLIGLFQRYPSLCLQLQRHDQQGFRYWSSWADDAEMKPRVHYSAETQQVVEELRCDLESGRFRHIRLIGEPGVGKTRLALEVTRAPNFAPVTLYLPDCRALQQSSFLNELIQRDSKRFVILVIDDCSRKDSAEIWNVLKSRSEHVRVVTIDHGPDTSLDDQTRVLQVELTGIEEITAILTEYGVERYEAQRFAALCKGCPRVAHVVGQNLQANQADLLRPPGIVDVWDRFVDGHDDHNSDDAQLRRIVLRYVSLFERFGFAQPVEDEARFIAGMAEKCDARLNWQRFQSVVTELRRRRIIQGATTLYITPRLLHIHLYREFWNFYGTGFDIAEELLNMPPHLQHWFITMLEYAEESSIGKEAIGRLMGPGGILSDAAFPDNQPIGRLIMALAVSCPKPTLRCLQRTIGTTETSRLLEIRAARQQIVWALERLAVWDDCFSGSADLLLRLAEAENCTYTNNATGTLVGLFSLVPGMAATQAPASRRIAYLRKLLGSDSAEKRRIGLAAAKAALSTNGNSRTVGPEHQGLRKRIEFWFPKTYGDLWDAYREVWEVLVGKLQFWEGEERAELVQAIVSSANSALFIRPLRSAVVQTLESIADESELDLKSLVQFVQRWLKHSRAHLTDDDVARLESLNVKLGGHDFRTRLRRSVKFATYEDFFDDSGQMSNSVNARLEELAREGIASRRVLDPELNWLIREGSTTAFWFARRLADNDPERVLLADLLNVYEMHRDNTRHTFLGGYLASVYDTYPAEWESLVLALAERPCFQNQFGDLVISSGMSNPVARKVIDRYRSGILEPATLNNWWFSPRLRQVDEPLFLELIDVQLDRNEAQAWDGTTQMLYAYYQEKHVLKALPADNTYRVLTSCAMTGERTGDSAFYYWSRLAAAFLEQYPHRGWEFFQEILRLSTKRWNLLADLDMGQEQVLTKLFCSNPDRGWDCIAEVFSSERDDGTFFGIQHWLGDGGYRLVGSNAAGPIQFARSERVFQWVDANVREHGYWLTRAMPKTLNRTPAGRLTRDFVARYGKDESLCRSLWCHFQSRGWSGPESDYRRKLREEAREWLDGENDQTVIRWVEEYIERTGHAIERAEIEEERDIWRS